MKFELLLEISEKNPSDTFIDHLIKCAGNEKYEVLRENNGRKIVVLCKYKPKESIIYGVRWKSEL